MSRFYGSRFSAPYCPGVSSYVDDTTEGGKDCKSPLGFKFIIDKNGDCISPDGCSLAASGPVCPGISTGDVDLPGQKRRCKASGKTFEIDHNGRCVDPNNCATSLTDVVAKGAQALAEGASKLASKVGNTIKGAVKSVNDAYKMACPGIYTKDKNAVIPPEMAEKGAVAVCSKSGLPTVYLNGDGKQLGKKMRSKGKKMRSKGKKMRSKGKKMNSKGKKNSSKK
jgi:hypothetical protein